MAFMQVFYMPMPAAPATAQVQTSADGIDACARKDMPDWAKQGVVDLENVASSHR
jgi:hypothetical protein